MPESTIAEGTPVKNVGGRPKGAINKNAEQLLEAHIRDSIKYVTDIRTFAEEQLKEIRSQIRTIPLNERLTIMTQLMDIMDKMGKSMQVSVSCLNTINSSKPEDEEVDLKKLLGD